MTPYFGGPITPDTAAAVAYAGAHSFVSFSTPRQVGLAVEVCQSFALDNGAFPAWCAGRPVTDWSDYYDWAGGLSRVPSCDFAVVPDVIDGTEADNDALVREWPHGRHFGAPVWHLHESLSRLERLASDWPRICLGSSGEYAVIGTPAWWTRMVDVMRVVCDADGRPMVRFHGLRMLAPEVVLAFPFASADSTNIARNIGIDRAWSGSYQPPTKEARALLLRQRTEKINSPARFDFDKIGAIACAQEALW